MNKVLDLLDYKLGGSALESAKVYCEDPPTHLKSLGTLNILVNGHLEAQKIRCAFFEDPKTHQFFCASDSHKVFEDVTEKVEAKIQQKVGKTLKTAPQEEPRIKAGMVSPEFKQKLAGMIPTHPGRPIVFKPSEIFISKHR